MLMTVLVKKAVAISTKYLGRLREDKCKGMLPVLDAWLHFQTALASFPGQLVQLVYQLDIHLLLQKIESVLTEVWEARELKKDKQNDIPTQGLFMI